MLAEQTKPEQRAWFCDGCGVEARRMDGKPYPLPAGWVSENGEVRCLRCDQLRTKNLARTGDPAAREAVVALTRRELIRRPGASVKDLALALGVSRQIVTGTRQHLIHIGTIENQSKANKPVNDRTAERAEIKAKVENELRANSARPNSELARCTGSSANTVRRVREAFGIPGFNPHAGRLRLTVATLENLGTVTNESFSQATGGSYADSRKRLEALVAAGLASKTRNATSKRGSEKYEFTLIDSGDTRT